MDSAGREVNGEVKERFPGGGVQRFVLQSGDDPEIEPGGLRACRHCDQAG
ncbi:MAG TPA: hypothetical protein VIY52_03400 [Streptosporangiaceae bacterium]